MKAGITVISSLTAIAAAPVFLVDRPMTIEEWLEAEGVKIDPYALLRRDSRMGVINTTPEDEYILRRDWATTLINDNDILVFVPLPLHGGGGNSGGKMVLQILAVVVILALAVVTGGAAAALLGPATATTVAGVSITGLGLVGASTAAMIGQFVTAAILIAGTMALNAIFAPEAVDSDNKSNNYGIGNQQNVARIGGAIPVLYGTFNFYPDLIAAPYSEVINGETWLYLYMVLTQGECDVHQINMDSTPLSRFDRFAYKYEICPPYTATTLFPVAVLPSPAVSGQELRGASKSLEEAKAAREFDQSIWAPPLVEPFSGPYVLSDAGLAYSEIALDIGFPAGLIRISSTGDRHARAAAFCAQLRELGYSDNEYIQRPVVVDPNFYGGSGQALYGGPITCMGSNGGGAQGTYFHIWFDHHPGLLTKRSLPDNTLGDTDMTRWDGKYISNNNFDGAEDGAFDAGHLERYQTINLHNLTADAQGLVGGIPLEVLEGADLQVVNVEEVTGIYGAADSNKTYYKVTVEAPVQDRSLNLWKEGEEYKVGDYTGRTEDDLAFDPDDASAAMTLVSPYRAVRTHTATQANKVKPFPTTPGVAWNPPAWSGSNVYTTGDYVKYSTYEYQAQKDINMGGSAPNPVWSNYNNGTSYVIGDQVYYDGTMYRCTANSTGHTPPNASYWAVADWINRDYAAGIIIWQNATQDLRLNTAELGTNYMTIVEMSNTGNISPNTAGMIGVGGHGVTYSKWYSFGTAASMEWDVAATAVDPNGDPERSNMWIVSGTPYAVASRWYDSRYETGTYRPDRTVVDWNRPPAVTNSSVMGTPLPQATFVISSATSNQFTKTVKSTVANITDEATGLDEYGNKWADYAGPWVNGHAYVIGDRVNIGPSVYECNTNHTSSASNKPPMANWTSIPSIKRVPKKFGRFELRIRQLTTERVSTEHAQNAAVLSSVKLYLPERKHYGNITTLAIKLKASYGFNSSTKNKLNVVATRRIPEYRLASGVDIKENGITLRSKYGCGAAEVEFDTDAGAAAYDVGSLISLSGLADTPIGGIPAAMYSGARGLLARLSSKSFLVMPDKIVRLYADHPPLEGVVTSLLAPAWSAGTYVAGDLVSRLGVNYRCSATSTTSTPPGAHWTVVTDKVLTLSGISMAPTGDGPDNLATMSLRVVRNGTFVTKTLPKSDLAVRGTHGSAILKVYWKGHGMYVGDDFMFSFVPDSVPSISGIQRSIWGKTRNEAGVLAGSNSPTSYMDLRRCAHTVSRVIDADNFEFTMTTQRGIVHDLADLEVEVNVPGAVSPSNARFSHLLTGGKHYAVPNSLKAWKSTTTYSSSTMVIWKNTVYLWTASSTNAEPGTPAGASKWSVSTHQEYNTPAHVVNTAYKNGRIEVQPPFYTSGLKPIYYLGEWCRHRLNGTGPVRYYQCIAASAGGVNNVSPTYPGSNPAVWREKNRATDGDPTWYFDIVDVDVTNNRYEISSGETVWASDFSGEAQSLLGMYCQVNSKVAMDLAGQQFRVARPLEHRITHNTNTAVAITSTGADYIAVGDRVQVVLSGYAVTDGATATGQTAILADLGENPGWSQNKPTRSIAWAFADVLHNTTYGCKLADSQIGLTDLLALDQFWAGRGSAAGTDRDPTTPPPWVVDHAYLQYDRVSLSIGEPDRLYYAVKDHTSTSDTRPDKTTAYGYWRAASAGVPDTFNGIFDRQVTTWSALQAISGVGRGAPTIKHGTTVTIVRDDYKVIPKQMFSDRNIIPGSMKISYVAFTDDENDSLSLRFINEKTWKPDEVLAFAADPINPFYYCAGYIEGNLLTTVPVTWTSGRVFKKNEYVMHSNVQYISLADNNSAHTPNSSPTWWSVEPVVFTEENTLDNLTWEDGTDVTIVTYISETSVIVSIFDRKGTPDAPQEFTIHKGTHANPASMEGFGFTNRKQTWREAKFRVDSTRNRRANITFSTELEGLHCTYGDRVIVTGLWGQAGDVTGVTVDGADTYIDLDRDLFFKDEGGLDYAMAANPVTTKQGSRFISFSSSKPHRVHPGSVITLSGLSGTVGGINTATFNSTQQVIHSAEDEYTFTILHTIDATDDASGGGLLGFYHVNYDSTVLNVVFRKVDGGVVGPMALVFSELPSADNYFQRIKVATSDLDGFTPVFDTDQEKTHYLIGESNSFRRDCKVVSMRPTETTVEIALFDDGDNSHYNSDLTYKYVSDIDTDTIQRNEPAPYFIYEFDSDGLPKPVVTVSVSGTAAAPRVRVAWTPAIGAVSYLVQSSDALTTQPSWNDEARVDSLFVDLEAKLGQIVEYRVFPIGFGPGEPAYFSGVARFDSTTGTTISFPGQIIKTGANIDIEPLDDTDSTTIAALENKTDRTPYGVKNGFNKHFQLSARPIRHDQVIVYFGTPQQALRYVPTRAYSITGSCMTGGSDDTRTDIVISRPLIYLPPESAVNQLWPGVVVGDRVRFIGSVGLHYSSASSMFAAYNNSTSYAVGNYVGYSGSWYRCIQASTGNLPTNDAYWALLVDGDLIISGENVVAGAPLWVSGTAYTTGDVVRDAYGNKYSAATSATATASNAPPISTHWTPVNDGYEVVGQSGSSMPNAWSGATNYSIGGLASVTYGARTYVLAASRAHTNKEPFVDAEWELYWDEIPVEEWGNLYGSITLNVDMADAEFESGFATTESGTLRFDGTPAPDEPSTTLPSYAFFVVPNQDRIYVYDPGHGFAEGFCDTAVAFTVPELTYVDADYSVCGVPKEYVVSSDTDFASGINTVIHSIYVIDKNVYYFIPKTITGTRLTSAQIPTESRFDGDGTEIRYKLPLVLITPKLGPSDFTVYGKDLVLGVAPRNTDDLVVRYASRE